VSDTPTPTQPTEHRHVALLELARLVRQLRAVQKKAGKGYKTPDDGGRATVLEHKLDTLLERLPQ
jgi:hypothetical protein